MPKRLRAGEPCASGRHQLRQRDLGWRRDRPSERFCLPCAALRARAYRARRKAGIPPVVREGVSYRIEQPWERQVRNRPDPEEMSASFTRYQ